MGVWDVACLDTVKRPRSQREIRVRMRDVGEQGGGGWGDAFQASNIDFKALMHLRNSGKKKSE